MPTSLSAAKIRNATPRTKQYKLQMCGQIFMYAIATGRAERNPVPDLRGALKTPVVKHHSFLKASELGGQAFGFFLRFARIASGGEHLTSKVPTHLR
jgi:hypothetical protein